MDMASGRWLDLWKHDREEFFRLARASLWGNSKRGKTAGRNPAGRNPTGDSLTGLNALLPSFPPNDRKEIIPVLVKMADTMSLKVPSHAFPKDDGAQETAFRLVFFPVISLPSGWSPEGRMLVKSLLSSWDIAGARSKFIFYPHLLCPEALANMGLTERRLLLKKICQKRPLPKDMAFFHVDMAHSVSPPASKQYPSQEGRAAYIAGAIPLLAESGPVPLLDDDQASFDRSGTTAILSDMLRADEGLLDIAKPKSHLFGDSFLDFTAFHFIVSKSGVREEILSFISEAKIYAKQQGANSESDAELNAKTLEEVHAEIIFNNKVCDSDYTGGDKGALVVLKDGRGNAIDYRHFYYELSPISRYELKRIICENTDSVTLSTSQPPQTIFQSNTRSAGRPPRNKPARRAFRVIVGGRTQKMIDDMEEWGRGLRKNIEKVSLNGQNKSE